MSRLLTNYILFFFSIFLNQRDPASERHQLNLHLAESINICSPTKATIHTLGITERLYPN